jgi:fructose PTS system EIIBC or EIIC component
MKLFELLDEKNILVELKGGSKEAVINELIDLFKGDKRVKDIEKIREAVFSREKIMSTGVGKGFAIPHGKSNSVEDILAAFGKTKKNIDYDALDGEPVNLIFLLIGKESMVSAHIKLLSRISRLMNNDSFREQLVNAETKEEILSLFKKEEEPFFEI